MLAWVRRERLLLLAASASALAPAAAAAAERQRRRSVLLCTVTTRTLTPCPFRRISHRTLLPAQSSSRALEHTAKPFFRHRLMASSTLLLDGHLIDGAAAGPASPAASSSSSPLPPATPDRPKGLLGQIGAKGVGAMTGAVATSLLSSSHPSLDRCSTQPSDKRAGSTSARAPVSDADEPRPTSSQ